MKGLRSSTSTFSPGARQVAGGHQAVVARADDDGVIAVCRSRAHARRAARSAVRPAPGASCRANRACASMATSNAVQRVLEARVIVRRGHEPRLARIRLAQDALIVQHLRHGVVEGIVAALPVAVGARRIVREVQAAHGRVADEAVRDAARLEDRAHAAAQARAVGGDALQRIGLVENLQGLLRRRQRHRVRGIGAAVRDPLADLAHDVLAAREHRDRIAVGERLGEGAQVGLHAVELLHAAARDAKAGLDLIDDQHHAVAVAQLARRAHVVRLGGDAQAIAHDRLDQQAGDRVGRGA